MNFELEVLYQLAIKKHGFHKKSLVLNKWFFFVVLSPTEKKVLYMYVDKYVYLEKIYKDKKKRGNLGYSPF